LYFAAKGLILIKVDRKPIMKDNKQVVLVADDEAVIRELIQRVLTESGYEVIVAESGEQAIELVRTVHLDLILLDINMPGIGGLVALREILGQASASRVIMLTAVNDPNIAKTVMELGALDYLTKPIDIVTLKKAIHTHLLFAA
jgi:DNA-binding response OmpR family regulator